MVIDIALKKGVVNYSSRGSRGFEREEGITSFLNNPLPALRFWQLNDSAKEPMQDLVCRGWSTTLKTLTNKGNELDPP